MLDVVVNLAEQTGRVEEAAGSAGDLGLRDRDWLGEGQGEGLLVC